MKGSAATTAWIERDWTMLAMTESATLCDCGNALDEWTTGGCCEWCHDESPRPAGEWPAGVAWDDLTDEWFDYFTSSAWDFPPTCCGRVIRYRATPWTHGDCVQCGTSVYC